MRVWVAGHRGFVGRAVVDLLRADRHDVLTDSLDLRVAEDVRSWVYAVKPDAIVLAAARAGGVLSNRRFPVEHLRQNLEIQTSVIGSALSAGVERLIFLGTSCVYPRDAPQPFVETALLTGSLEPTTEAYAIAKIAGIKLCQAGNRQCGARYVSLLPCNLYGPGDNYDLERGHVVAGLIRRVYEARCAGADSVELWGTGSPLRELMHVDDLARAVARVLETDPADDVLNCGSGEEISTLALATELCRIAGFTGRIVTNALRPNGAPRKLMDSTRLRALGWAPQVPIERGLRETYAAYGGTK